MHNRGSVVETRLVLLVHIVSFALLFAVVSCNNTSRVTPTRLAADNSVPTVPAPSDSAGSVSPSATSSDAIPTRVVSDLAATPTPTILIKATTPTAPSQRLVFASASKPPLAWAQLMVQQVSLSKTAYEHKETVVTWAGVDNASEYSSYADCSGFMNALLAQADGLSAEDFKNWLGARRPFAKDYYGAITASRGFIPITNIGNVQPGDMIAIRYPNSAPGDNTGHILLVAATPQHRTATKPTVNATQQWDVLIIDSSESGHGKDDTRRLPDGTFHDGVGRGTLRLYADNGGALVGYTWSDLSDSLYYGQTERPLAIGRLDPKFTLP